MEFIETAIFTKHVYEILEEEEYGELQTYLAANPEAGNLIPNTGGMRKIRIASSGRGKRGGARTIYYWQRNRFRISLMAIYAKNTQIDLPPKQKIILSSLLEDTQDG